MNKKNEKNNSEKGKSEDLMLKINEKIAEEDKKKELHWFILYRKFLIFLNERILDI